MRGEQKFRPYFSASELTEVITALKESPSPKRLGIIRYLETYAIKIERGVISPAHTNDPSIEQKLGFEPATDIAPLEEETLYTWMCDPTKKLSPKQLKIAMDYAYRNNLLSSEQEVEYEQENGLTGLTD